MRYQWYWVGNEDPLLTGMPVTLWRCYDEILAQAIEEWLNATVDRNNNLPQAS